MATPSKDISEYSYEELQKAADEKKDAKITEVRTKLSASIELTATLEKQLSDLTGVVPKKRGGRPPGIKNRFPGKKTSKKTGKRGARKGKVTAKDAVLAVLGKGPATSKEIIAAAKLNPGSINQALVLLKKSKEIKHDGKKGGKYSVGK